MSKSYKLYFLLALVLLVAPLLVACGDKPAGTTTPVATPAFVVTTVPATVAFTSTTPSVAPTTGTPTPTLAAATVAATPTVTATDAVEDISPLVDKMMANLPFQTFTSKEGMFSVDFPGEPDMRSNSLDDGEGPINEHYFRVFVPIKKASDEKITFFAGYTDYPASLVKSLGQAGLMKRELKDLPDSYMVNNLKDIQLGAISGKSFTFGSANSVVGYGRIYIDGSRAYELFIDNTYYLTLPDDFKPFFDSFKLTGDVATTDPTATSGKVNDDLVKLKLDQVFYDSFASKFTEASNVTINFYTSNTDSATLAKTLHAEALQEGYTSPVSPDDDPYLGRYSKTGQPDLFFGINDTPSDVAGVQTLWSNLDVNANQTAVTNLLQQVKGTKSVVLIVTGTGVMPIVNNTLSAYDATPTTAASSDITTTQTASGENAFTVSMQKVLIDGKFDLSDVATDLAASFPGATNLTMAVYASQQPITKLTDQVDTTLKAAGYAFIPSSEGDTAPVKQDFGYAALYVQDGQPDVLLQIVEIPDDDAAIVQTFVQRGLSASKAQEIAHYFKGEKSAMLAITGTNLSKAVVTK